MMKIFDEITINGENIGSELIKDIIDSANIYIKNLYQNKPKDNDNSRLFNNIILIIIFVIIIKIIKRKLFKKMINVDKKEGNIRHKNKIIYFNKKKYLIINAINYFLVFIIKLIIVINFNNQSQCNRIDFHESKITLKIKGIGEKAILGNAYDKTFKGINHLKEVIINGYKQDTTGYKYKYYFNKTENNVELIWDEDIDSTAYMFYGCTEITEINLSNFKSSNVRNMDEMFVSCSSLISLDLSNFDTSNIKSMNRLFYYCFNLEFINLNNFKDNNLDKMGEYFFIVEKINVICINENITKESILINSNILLNKGLCSKCNLNYYPKKNSNDNSGGYLNCYIKDEKSKEKEIKYYDDVIKILETIFTAEDYDTSNIDNGQDEIIKTGKITTTLTTTENQRNKTNNNMTRIDLGKCEILLRNFSNLSDNEKLYIKKIDIYPERLNGLKVVFDVYAKLNGTNLINLNLSVCEGIKISILIPNVSIDNIDKLNLNSGYYNDICYTATSDGTDITLKDRQIEYVEHYNILHQEGCDFSEYNYETLIANYLCNVKKINESFTDLQINEENEYKILNYFKKIKNFLNFKILTCYRKLFNKEGIINNIGCFILFAIILFHIITIIVFSINQFPVLKNKIKKITYEKNYLKSIK